MSDMKPSGAIVLVIIALMMLYVSWTLWQPVWRDWAMVAGGVTVLATVTDVVSAPGDGGVHWASITVPRTDGTSFDGRIRGWARHRFAVGDQLKVRYHPSGRVEPRLVDRWPWKAAAASLTAHIVQFVLALGTSIVGTGMIVRVAIDLHL